MHILRLFIKWLQSVLRDSQMRQRIKNSSPTACLYSGVFVDKITSLGNYVVLFSGVSITSSSIGSHTYVQKSSIIHEADVGKFCSIAGGVWIGLPQHDVCMVSSHPAFYLKDTPLAKTYSDQNYFTTTKRTKVGHDVWIGHGALIMSGVRIGNGAVIGAGAVVTKNVADYEIVAGVPARHIRYRFSEIEIRELTKICWWDMPEKWLEENANLFRDKNKFINELGTPE